MFAMSVTSEHSLGTMLNKPTNNGIKHAISTKPQCVNFKVLPIRFDGKLASHSKKTDMAMTTMKVMAMMSMSIIMNN